MTKPKILIGGATGRTGLAIVQQLRDLNWPVRAIVRKHDRRSERLVALGAEIVVADLFDPIQLRAAMAGVSRAYYCGPWHPHMLQSATAFALAAEESRLESIVGLSQWIASPDHPSLATRQQWLVDQLWPKLQGVAHTIVNPGFFADNYMQVLHYASHLGVFPMPLRGDGQNAPPSNEDIARVVVGALTRPDLHAGKTYRPTGPKLLSVDEMVAVMSQVLGRRLTHLPLPLWMFFKAGRWAGFGKFALSSVRHYFRDHDQGAFAHGAPTSHVLDVSGREPEDFATIVRRYANAPAVRPGLANSVRTLAEFLAVPILPGLNATAYDEALETPQPPEPRLAIESKHWRDERPPSLAGAA